jgi:opacity protein-like surface antigen/outer membrane protease
MLVCKFRTAMVSAIVSRGRHASRPASTQLSIFGFCFFAVALAGEARAADMPATPPPVMPLWTWTGGYVGTHIGAAWGDTKFSDPAGISLYGDQVSTPGAIGGFQAGYNWQVPQSRFVLGIEGDLSGLVSKGSNTCLASSRLVVSADCRNEPNASATITPRIGYAIDPLGRTLAYIKGGFAAVHDSTEISTNGTTPKTETTDRFWTMGWTVGAGVERALTPAWSLKLEYDYLGLGRANVATPPGQVQTIPGDFTSYQATPAGTTSLSQNVQEVKFGLNYRFGVDPFAHWDLPQWASTPLPAKAAWSAGAEPRGFAAWFSGWQFEAGTRYWLSFGKFQKDLGGDSSSANANVLVSRLSYHSEGDSGEFFTRVDSPQRLFVKGLIGTGSLSSGYLNDEDWAQVGIAGVASSSLGSWPSTSSSTVAYSNTRSNVQGTLGYATADIGYNLMEAPDYKFGAFIGYNYYRENKQAYGCVQISNEFSDCVTPLPNTVLAITEDDTWNSLRVGFNGDMMLLPRLRLNADAAFIPYTQFSGVDIHWQRTDVANQTSTETGRGMGVQLDAILTYYFTPAFSVGAGGRYWAMWTNDNAYTNIFGTSCPCQTLPAKTDRYGLLLQASYKFGVADAVAVR